MAHLLQISTNLSYDPVTLLVNQPLKIVNKCFVDDLVFKIKTNQKNLVSMTINHGFIKPGEIINIQVKIVEKVEQGVNIKLQVNWAIATPEVKSKNDSKMGTITKQAIFKSSFPILRKIQVDGQSVKKSQQTKSFQSPSNPTTSFKVQDKQDLYASVGSQRKSQNVNINDKSTKAIIQETRLIPQNITEQIISNETKASSLAAGKTTNVIISAEKPAKQVTQSPVISQFKVEKSSSLSLTEQIMLDPDHEERSYQQHKQTQKIKIQLSKSAQSIPHSSSLGQTHHNLEIVAEQDEQDPQKYEKQIQTIKKQQINQIRLTDQIKTKVSRLRTQMKGKQIISFEQLLIILCAVFLLGGIIGDFIF